MGLPLATNAFQIRYCFTLSLIATVGDVRLYMYMSKQLSSVCLACSGPPDLFMYYVCKNTRVHLYVHVVCSPIVFNVHIFACMYCTCTCTYPHTYIHVHAPPPSHTHTHICSIMFWTDYGNDPRIKRARMDGTLETTIFRRSGSFSNFIHPNDVAIDYNTDFLYFVEGVSGSLSVSTFNGNGRRSLISKDTDSSYIKKPRSLTIRHISEQYQDGDQRTEESFVFWSDPDLRVISRADIVTEGRSTANVRRSDLRRVLPKETEYVPYAVQFVSMHGHREGGERGGWEGGRGEGEKGG